MGWSTIPKIIQIGSKAKKAKNVKDAKRRIWKQMDKDQRKFFKGSAKVLDEFEKGKK